MEYNYPIDHDWSTQEIVDVIHFYEGIEKAYEKGIKREELMNLYRRFKEIVPGKADEKNWFRAFLDESGMDPYPVIRDMKQRNEGSVLKGY
ncbi:UPF0223 family protein [Bacillus carboniphilus]|uniref:UPF0223 family protein n=1 Tax=Bacillus carboniphilus TaxID=86663 RepID=A0ABP3G7X5_9BACI